VQQGGLSLFFLSRIMHCIATSFHKLDFLVTWNCLIRIAEVIQLMRIFTAIVERCTDTGLYVGYVPGFPGAHSQGQTLDELQENLREVIAMLLDSVAV
jgi:predicted RNase H-like HicB family nuclease